VIDRLQDEIAKLFAQIGKVLALDRVGNLVSFLDRVVADGGEVLLQIPWAAGLRIAQAGHDFDEAREVAGGLHFEGTGLESDGLRTLAQVARLPNGALGSADRSFA
jgi:hypothetical protein